MEEALFVRSLALEAPVDDAQSLTSASRTTSDATFAVASGREGLIRVYAASCAALLHEFASIHSCVYTLHYTSFSDSLVTLESDIKEHDNNTEDVETFLCVYHDWRERKMVRGYTLPLGVLESPSSNRKADCVAVCSFTGRVIVAMGTVLNIWQCSHGFFEHVMELKVDMAQHHAFLQVEYVAIHGVYVAFASPTEVRVMEIHVQNSRENEEAVQVETGLNATTGLDEWSRTREDGDSVPMDSAQCINISSLDDLHAIVEVPVSCSVYSTVEADSRQEIEEQRIFDEQEQIPMVLGRNEAQQEVWNLAGLVKSQDIRTNQAMSYFIGENDVSVLLQRYLPPNNSIQSLKFLPETIDNRVCVETRSYSRLLVATEKHAFLYYFLSKHVDLTRKKMVKKVFGKNERTRSRGMHQPIKVAKFVAGQRRDSFTSVDMKGDENEGEIESSAESGRVVMHYNFTSTVTSITANSSFLFVATLSGLQVWSIWSPCHYVAASRALNKSLVPQPSQPHLLYTQPMPYPVSQLAALDSYVVLQPQVHSSRVKGPHDIIHMASLAAAECLPSAEFEMRPRHDYRQDAMQRSIVIFQQSPPSLMFSYVRQSLLSTEGAMKPFQIDLLLTLFSLYRYRADVGSDILRLATSNRAEGASTISDRKETLALELETTLYDNLAKDCAAALAGVYMSEPHRNLERAAFLFVASNVPSIEVMQRLQAIVGTVNRSEVIQATGKYLEAFVFPPLNSLSDICSPQQKQNTSLGAAKFTRIVLEHYDKYFPEQLSRLIVDSSLIWTLEDIEFTLKKLDESSSSSVLVHIARLVLVLRASTFSIEDWNAFQVCKGKAGKGFIQQCSDTSQLALIDYMLENHVDALIQLTVAHPDLLVQEISSKDTATPNYIRRFSSSKLTKALVEKAPVRYLDVLERVFRTAIGRQETIRSTLLFCLNSIGDAAVPSARKVASSDSSIPVDVDLLSSVFVPDQVLVLRFLMFVIKMVPALEVVSEKEEVQDDAEDLQRAKAAVAAELMRLSVKLSSCFRDLEKYDEDGRVEATVCDLFEPIIIEPATHTLPRWVLEYLEVRCLPKPPRLRKSLRYIFAQALELLHQKDLVCPQDVLLMYERFDGETLEQGLWNIENNLGTLVVLLTLPRVSRTVDGLKLIAQRADLSYLFLPYGKNFCATLKEWRFLISMLSSMSKNATETATEGSSSILKSILDHVCLTLSPEDLLQVLPDEGDIALYLSTIEVSMRLDQVRTFHPNSVVAG